MCAYSEFGTYRKLPPPPQRLGAYSEWPLNSILDAYFVIYGTECFSKNSVKIFRVGLLQNSSRQLLVNLWRFKNKDSRMTIKLRLDRNNQKKKPMICFSYINIYIYIYIYILILDTPRR